MMTEPRIVVFKVSGTIYLESPLALGADNSYVTVAGQTAPGDGIAIAPVEGAEAYLWLGGYGKGDFHDGVFRYLRFRSGRGGTANQYRFSAAVFEGGHRIVFDHNSFTWSGDQIVNHWQPRIRDITWQWNIIGEGSGQNAGSLFARGPHERISFHHNYLAHKNFRNYAVETGTYQFINNVSYNTFNWDYHFTDYVPGGTPTAIDVINHYFKEGPDTNRHYPFDVNRGYLSATGVTGLPQQA